MSQNLTAQTLAIVQAEMQQRQLPAEFQQTVEQWYLPLAQQVADLHQREQRCLLISFNGAQGSGKSTLTAFLQLILPQQFGLNAVTISIDDFYLTRAERQRLANEVHPLLATRGVPGTHDVQLASDTLACLRHCSPEHPCRLPLFDKSMDDRADPTQWAVIDRSVDVILFEGWCNHSPVSSSQELLHPINDLERDEDRDGRWRHYVNDQLALYHQRLFDQADLLVFLKVPSFEKVYEWRGLQEQKLAQSAGNLQGVMNEQQLKRFIQHYERITRQNLLKLPALADIMLTLNETHGIDAMYCKADEAGHV